ncbi:UDP-2,3-diacylglucosamine diphosphatase [Methanolobus profundi]|uniref:Calcineurin-like phosphoesterase superfamily domain-containing protein n=1 Tax=Methanolobus profundi TaxID=487685 RepID=A0A1I4U3W2_9EURY|nr:UDP-2,3-diacylglucosamine diphosphatase [Methanolobus profundi]SFM83501.1 Calcineurin-like phosphoesterase superfamily domain-containing protein [Methanolobus profundi]
MSIIAVSDVHLGMDGARKDDFTEFIHRVKDMGADHLVLLGDIIDIWRRDFTKAVIECSEPLNALNDILDDTQVHYVVGNHDYYMLRLSEKLKENFPFEVEKTTVIKSMNKEFFFFHGYQLEVLCNPHYKSMQTYEKFSEQMCLAGDDEGDIADAAWKIYQAGRAYIDKLKRLPENIYAAFDSMGNPPEKRLRGKHDALGSIKDLAGASTRHYLLSIRPEQYMIYGHTHEAYVDKRNMVANTGSWGFGKDEKLEYIEIANDEVELKEFVP